MNFVGPMHFFKFFHDRNVQIIGGGKAELPLQIDLARRRIQQVYAADDLRNFLVGIVDDDREVVCNQAVAPPDNKVPGQRFKVLLLGSLQQIVECNWLVIDAYSDRKFFAVTAVSAGTRVDDAQRATPGICQIAPGTGTPIGEPVCQQCPQQLAMARGIPVLIQNRAIPLEAIGFQCVDNSLLSTSPCTPPASTSSIKSIQVARAACPARRSRCCARAAAPRSMQ